MNTAEAVTATAVAGAVAFLALCWLLIRSREAADAERRARDPQGAAARVERRLMAEDPAYRLCRRATGAVLCLPKGGRAVKLPLVLEACGTVRTPCPRRRAILETKGRE